MRRFFSALRRVLETEKDVKVVYPVYLNPIVQQTAWQVNILQTQFPNILRKNNKVIAN